MVSLMTSKKILIIIHNQSLNEYDVKYGLNNKLKYVLIKQAIL